MIGLAFALAATAPRLPSSPDLGMAEGRCREEEHGPSFMVTVNGLKDRKGRLKLELYPADDEDFLADDNVLIAAGKVFRRVEMAIPASGPVHMCIRAPGPGLYALSLLHDRNGDRKFALSVDGIGFAGNPRLGMRKPPAQSASAHALTGPTPVAITLNYRRGLFSFGPLEQ